MAESARRLANTNPGKRVQDFTAVLGLLANVVQLASPFFPTPQTGVLVPVAVVFGVLGALVFVAHGVGRCRTAGFSWWSRTWPIAVAVLMLIIAVGVPNLVGSPPPDRCVHALPVEVRGDQQLAPSAGIDLDCNRVLDPVEGTPGYEISSQRGGRQLDSLGGRPALARLPQLALTDFDRCATTPVDRYEKSVDRLDRPTDGSGICVRTTGGNIAIVLPTTPSLPDGVFNFRYAVRYER